jgi:hypothetical protein
MGRAQQRSAATVADVLGHADDSPWHFAGVKQSCDRLSRAGFKAIDVALRPDLAVLVSAEQLGSYLATVVLGPQLTQLDPDQHQSTPTSTGGLSLRLPPGLTSQSRTMSA